MTVTIEVLRMEHVHDCSARADSGVMPHGPHAGASCYDPDNAPRYGGKGRAPRTIESHQRCGVTREQMDAWWSTDYADATAERVVKAYRAGWRMSTYEVPVESAWIDRGQVVFDAETAVRTGELTKSEALESFYRAPAVPGDFHDVAYRAERLHCAQTSGSVLIASGAAS